MLVRNNLYGVSMDIEGPIPKRGTPEWEEFLDKRALRILDECLWIDAEEFYRIAKAYEREWARVKWRRRGKSV